MESKLSEEIQTCGRSHVSTKFLLHFIKQLYKSEYSPTFDNLFLCFQASDEIRQIKFSCQVYCKFLNYFIKCVLIKYETFLTYNLNNESVNGESSRRKWEIKQKLRTSLLLNFNFRWFNHFRSMIVLLTDSAWFVCGLITRCGKISSLLRLFWTVREVQINSVISSISEISSRIFFASTLRGTSTRF